MPFSGRVIPVSPQANPTFKDQDALNYVLLHGPQRGGKKDARSLARTLDWGVLPRRLATGNLSGMPLPPSHLPCPIQVLSTTAVSEWVQGSCALVTLSASIEID